MHYLPASFPWPGPCGVQLYKTPCPTILDVVPYTVTNTLTKHSKQNDFGIHAFKWSVRHAEAYMYKANLELPKHTA